MMALQNPNSHRLPFWKACTGHGPWMAHVGCLQIYLIFSLYTFNVGTFQCSAYGVLIAETYKSKDQARDQVPAAGLPSPVVMFTRAFWRETSELVVEGARAIL